MHYKLCMMLLIMGSSKRLSKMKESKPYLIDMALNIKG